MKTTLTLNDDLVAKLQEQTRSTGKSLKEVVNETLRLGLRVQSKIVADAAIEPFRVNAHPLRAKQGVDYDSIAALLEQAEGLTQR